MTKADVKTDREAYFALRILVERATNAVSKLMVRKSEDTGKCGSCKKASTLCKMDTACFIDVWWNREPGRCVRRLSTFALPSSIKFIRGHKSMSTKQLFQFAHWVIDLGRLTIDSSIASQDNAELEELDKLDSGFDHIFKVLRVDRADKTISNSIVHPLGSDFLKSRSDRLEGLSRKRVSEWGMEALSESEASVEREKEKNESEEEEGYEI